MNICFENYWKLVIKWFFSEFINVTIVFQVWYSEINTENTMSNLYFNEGSDNSEENAVWAWTEKKLVVMRAIRK